MRIIPDIALRRQSGWAGSRCDNLPNGYGLDDIRHTRMFESSHIAGRKWSLAGGPVKAAPIYACHACELMSKGAIPEFEFVEIVAASKDGVNFRRHTLASVSTVICRNTQLLLEECGGEG